MSDKEIDAHTKLSGETEKVERELSERGHQELITAHLMEKEGWDLSVRLSKSWKCEQLWGRYSVQLSPEG